MITLKATTHSVTYGAIGIVTGSMWGGGTASYTARSLGPYKKRSTLYIAIQHKLEDGSLDAGMGFKDLIYADMNIIRSESYTIKGKTFTNQRSSNVKRFK